MTSKYAPLSLADQPQPYEYQYGVKDDYSKTNFAKTESQDAQVTTHFGEGRMIFLSSSIQMK